MNSPSGEGSQSQNRRRLTSGTGCGTQNRRSAIESGGAAAAAETTKAGEDRPSAGPATGGQETKMTGSLGC